VHPDRSLAVVLLVAATTLAASACDRGGSTGPRNVLLISIDSLRADRVGAYGNARAVTPAIDRLAREGVVFERAYSATAWTLPSHVTLLTGRLPHHHGTIGWKDTIAPSEHLLQESFARRGYETVGFYSGPLLHPYYGFDRGFDAYRSCMSHDYDATDVKMKGLVESHADRTNAAVEKAFRVWVEGRSARPFFAFVHMWDVHYDYIPPEPYASMFDPLYAGPLNGRNIVGAGFPEKPDPRDLQHLLALYDGELRSTDDTIAHLLDALRAAGALSDTLVVVTSDHGEEFMEHGGKTHHRTVYDESVHVPLVVWSERSGFVRGRRVADPVSLADVAPTIAELAGVEPMPDADGRSLAPALRGEPLPPRPVLSGMYVPGQEWRRTLAVRDAARTLVLWKKHDQWMSFDAARDPGDRHPTMLAEGPERRPLEDYDAEVVALLASRSDAAPEFLAAVRSGGSAVAPDAATSAATTGATQPPADVADRLRTLGYVQ